MTYYQEDRIYLLGIIGQKPRTLSSVVLNTTMRAWRSREKDTAIFRDHDIFEKHPDRGTIWREAVQGLESARARLKKLAQHSTHEFFAMYVPTKEIVARVNASE